LVDSELRKQEGQNEEDNEIDESSAPKGAQLVTPDGAYISQSVFSTVAVKQDEKM
jgi:hypothetical protein